MIYKALNKVRKLYRENIFKKLTGNKEKVTIYGSIHIFNKNISYKENLKLFPNVCFMGDGKIEIGKNVAIGNDTIIYAAKTGGGVKIGDNVSIAAHTYIIDSNHKTRLGELINKQKLDSRKIIIGNDVWIADNCTILKGVNIGDGAVVGAKSLVNKDIDVNAIAFGIPAQIQNYRRNK